MQSLRLSRRSSVNWNHYTCSYRNGATADETPKFYKQAVYSLTVETESG